MQLDGLSVERRGVLAGKKIRYLINQNIEICSLELSDFRIKKKIF